MTLAILLLVYAVFTTLGTLAVVGSNVPSRDRIQVSVINGFGLVVMCLAAAVLL